MLAAKLVHGSASAYLVYTNWMEALMQPENTRQVIDAIHDGSLVIVEWEEMPVLGLLQPKSDIKDVPEGILRPHRRPWSVWSRPT